LWLSAFVAVFAKSSTEFAGGHREKVLSRSKMKSQPTSPERRDFLKAAGGALGAVTAFRL
jgi:hypothetical protein